MSNESNDDSDYDVGYGKPPKDHQFKEGQSGNPKGRPPKEPDTFSELVEDIWYLPFRIIENGVESKITTKEAVVLKLRNMLLNGSANEMLKALKMMEQLSPDMHKEDKGWQNLTLQFTDSDGTVLLSSDDEPGSG